MSIIDLSDAARQPMRKQGCGVIAFNGEVYDHAGHRSQLEGRGIRFDTSSDTEVLLRGLASAGFNFLRAVHGMYAFAWLEPSGRFLWLARDHAGMKPLYLWQGRQGIAFASEIRSLALAVKAIGGAVKMSGAAAASFLAWGSVPEPACILEGVEMVPADSALCIDVRDRTVTKVVPLGRVGYEKTSSNSDPVERVRRAVKSAVGRHLVSDIPVVLFLSGGIDSGILAAEIAKIARGGAGAVSVILGSRGTEDEPRLVTDLTTRLGLDVNFVSIDDWERQIDDAMEAYDQPSVDGLNTFLIARVARRLGFKVALSGVGADEVFGGYGHFHSPLRWLDQAAGVGQVAKWVGGALSASSRPGLRRGGLLLEGIARREPVQRAMRRLFPEPVIRALLPGAAAGTPSGLPRDPLLLESQTYLRDTLLRDTDVMGMAAGVEIRAPYLDPEVLGTARAIGTNTILRHSKPPKWLLREGWRTELERGTLQRHKTGFALDLSHWLRGPARPRVENAREALHDSPSVDKAALGQVWKRSEAALLTRHPAAWVPLFALVQLAEQFRRWGEPS